MVHILLLSTQNYSNRTDLHQIKSTVSTSQQPTQCQNQPLTLTYANLFMGHTALNKWASFNEHHKFSWIHKRQHDSDVARIASARTHFIPLVPPSPPAHFHPKLKWDQLFRNNMDFIKMAQNLICSKQCRSVRTTNSRGILICSKHASSNYSNKLKLSPPPSPARKL